MNLAAWMNAASALLMENGGTLPYSRRRVPTAPTILAVRDVWQGITASGGQMRHDVREEAERAELY